jgi:hypothetical protein
VAGAGRIEMATTATTTREPEGDRGRQTAVALEGFVRATGTSEGVSLAALSPIDRLRVRTRNSWYDITVVGPTDASVVIQGGAFFPDPCRARVSGASLGGSMLKLAWVGVGLCLEIHHDGRRIVTTPVREIRLPDEQECLAGPY